MDTDPDPDAPVQCDPLDFFSCGRQHKCAPAILEVGGTWFDTAICVEIMGDHKEGEGCHSLDHKGGLDTCGAGLLCWDPDPVTLVGMCVEMCEGPDAWAGGGCSENKLCNSDKEGIVNLCLATCTPLDDDCPVGCMCQQSSAYSAFWCARMWGELELGDSCSWAGECGSGMACADASVSNCNEETTASCCVAFCDVTAEEPCAGSGEVCTLVFEENMIDLDPLAVGVGHCRVDGAP